MSLQVETMGMGTVIEIGTESVGESHVITVEIIEITGISERVGISEITEIMPGTAGIPKTVETISIPGYLGMPGMRGRTENLRGIKSERKLWNVAVNVSVSVNVNVNARRI
jgi:hypothetical protein